jgi:type VI secretion system protein ImpH
MANSPGHENDPLVEELFRNPTHFAYFQAIRVLARANRQLFPSLADFLERGLVTRASLSLAFPATDLVAATRQPQPASPEPVDPSTEAPAAGPPAPPSKPLYQLTAACLGLYGVGSPLPSLYAQTVLAESQADERAIRDFLDLLAEPFYRLATLAHFQGQLAPRLLEFADQRGAEILHGLMGGLSPASRAAANLPLKPDQLELGQLELGQLTLWARHTRSARGLAFLLESLLGSPVTLEPAVPRTVALDESARSRLGHPQSPLLSEGALVGSETVDLSSKFRIHVAPPTEASLLNLLPGGPTRTKVNQLVATYNQEPLDFELALRYRPGPDQALALGQGRGGLGQTACLAPTPTTELLILSPNPPTPAWRSWADPPDPGTGAAPNSLAPPQAAPDQASPAAGELWP